MCKYTPRYTTMYMAVCEDQRKTRPSLEAVSQKSKEHGRGTRPCVSPCSAMWTLNLKLYMAATRIYTRVDVYTPVWCQVCQLLCQFCQLGDLMELWAGKNRQKNRRWRQKELYILAGTRRKKEEEKKRREDFLGIKSKKDNKKRRKTTSIPDHPEHSYLFLCFNSSSS